MCAHVCVHRERKKKIGREIDICACTCTDNTSPTTTRPYRQRALQQVGLSISVHSLNSCHFCKSITAAVHCAERRMTSTQCHTRLMWRLKCFSSKDNLKSMRRKKKGINKDSGNWQKMRATSLFSTCTLGVTSVTSWSCICSNPGAQCLLPTVPPSATVPLSSLPSSNIKTGIEQ